MVIPYTWALDPFTNAIVAIPYTGKRNHHRVISTSLVLFDSLQCIFRMQPTKNDHNHDIDVADLATREVSHKLRQAATSSAEALKRIVDDAIDGLGHEVLENLPSDVAISKCIWTVRKALNMHPARPTSLYFDIHGQAAILTKLYR